MKGGNEMSDELNEWLSRLPTGVNTKDPIELQSIINDSTRRLINLAFTKHAEGLIEDVKAGHLSLDLIKKSQQELTTTFFAAKEVLPPVTKEKIADALNTFAKMLRCQPPTPEDLKLYVYALEDMPYYKFQAACKALLKRHKWPRLPVPADFVEASADARDDIDSFMANLNYARSVFQLVAVSRRIPR